MTKQTTTSNQFGVITLDAPIQPDNSGSGQLTRGRRPAWLRVKAPANDKVNELRGLFRGKHLNTVCEEANCFL